jgi:hypothetical protein
MKSTFSFQFDGDNYWKTGAKDFKFCMEADHKHTYISHMKNSL